MSLLEELKRRNVFKVVIAYLAMAWLVLQLVDVILNNIIAPDWIFNVLMLFLAVGLPFAAFFAWAYELTPEGLKRESEVDRSQSVTPQTGKKLNLITLIAMTLALGYFAYDKFVLSEERDAALLESVRQAAAEQSLTAESEKSIAVLPFVNMSEDANNEFFSDGISEELLNLLAKVPGLRVIARTSSFAFKAKVVDIADIAQKLNVAYVLEGSVRKSGNTVRITAQLIRTDDSTHLWSETYDRTLDDIFAVQEEIASSVVEQLKLTLLGEAPSIIATDPEAYTLVLQANYLVSRGTAEDYERAIKLYERALKIAPDYPLAWVGLSGVYSNQVHAGFRPPGEGGRLAREAARRANTLNPELASVQRALAYVAMTFDQDLASTAGHLTRGLELEPYNIDLLTDGTLFLAYLGRQEPSIELGQHAVARDPEDPRTHFALAMAYFNAGRWDESIRENRTAVTLSPGFVWAHHYTGAALLFQGDPEAALAEFQLEADPEFRVKGATLALHALGRQVEFEQSFGALRDNWGSEWPSEIAQIYVQDDQHDLAFEWLDRAVAQNEAELWQQVSQEFYRPLHDDPRWLPLLRRIGASPEQLQSIEFKVRFPE